MLNKSVLALSAALACAGTAFATPVVLNPGTSVTLSSSNGGSASGPIVIGTFPQNVSANTFTASYVENVIADTNNPYCSGCLDFTYQVMNNGPAQIERLTTAVFGSQYQVSAAIATDPAYVAPFAVSRTSDGTLGILFDLLPGQQTQGIIFYTNATAYQLGMLSLQDGSTGDGPLAYVPAGTPYSPVPEPSSLLLLGSGLVGAAGVGRRKFASIFKK